MAPGKSGSPTEKRSESQGSQRNLSRLYCNPWPKILDVPEKNRHPTAEWATKFAPLKVILNVQHLKQSKSDTFLQFFQPELSRTQANSITGQHSV
jgi:hypothetical protein